MQFKTILLAAALSISSASARPCSYGYDANTAACPDYCAGTLRNHSNHDYICGDPRLGPKRLPTKLTIGDIVDPYDRFGGSCPGEFLAKWYNETAKSWIYPSNNGFQLNTEGVPISGKVLLEVGVRVDRFGSEYGSFMSPALAPYLQRGLPPSNLDTPADGAYPYNYHVYQVKTAFEVSSGPIAPWFGQAGQGVQYQLSTNIMGLIEGGFLERVSLDDEDNCGSQNPHQGPHQGQDS